MFFIFTLIYNLHPSLHKKKCFIIVEQKQTTASVRIKSMTPGGRIFFFFQLVEKWHFRNGKEWVLLIPFAHSCFLSWLGIHHRDFSHKPTSVMSRLQVSLFMTGSDCHSSCLRAPKFRLSPYSVPAGLTLDPPHPPRLNSCVFQQRANITCWWESGDIQPFNTASYTLKIQRMFGWGSIFYHHLRLYLPYWTYVMTWSP